MTDHIPDSAKESIIKRMLYDIIRATEVAAEKNVRKMGSEYPEKERRFMVYYEKVLPDRKSVV